MSENYLNHLKSFTKGRLNSLATPVLLMPRLYKRVVVSLVDLGFCVFTVWLAFYLRLGEFISLSGNSLWAIFVSVSIALPVFIILGLYRAIFRYSGWPALMAVARAVAIYGVLYAAVFTAIGIQDVPRTVGIIQPILLLMFVGASRAFARVWLGDRYEAILRQSTRPKVLVYGAGTTGRQLVGAIANSYEMKVVGFLDDDVALHGQVLNGQPIFNPNDLSSLVSGLSVSHVLLAMPGLSRARRNEILNQMRLARVAVRTLPSVADLAQGRVSVSSLHELDIDDLLGRDSVTPSAPLLSLNITNKVVMVTGAGGSIGSELCRQILSQNPTKLLLIEISEFALYAIHQELEGKLLERHIELVPLLANVRDVSRIREIVSTWRPNTIYHAAAYKHVPLVEHNPAEGLINNLFGTLRTAQVAVENGVSSFVLISTDKAVRPTNIMGASKRLAEMTLQALAATGPITTFSIVRFGNVLGSSGSVVPKFRGQIRDGGPITLTHPEITRYFMTIPEASQLVIQAGAMANGGDVFVLDMGESVKIIDLARRMIELSGLTLRDSENPEGDIEIEITGLRPGEKLYEELLIGENPQPTAHKRIMKAHEDYLAWDDLTIKLQEFESALTLNDVQVMRRLTQDLVAGYTAAEEIVDWVHMERSA